MDREKKLVPDLRFLEFTGEWEEKRLSELLVRYSKNNKDEEFFIDDILSLSSKYGIVDRKELLKDTYNKVNHLNYIKTRKYDLVYGKSISAKYPYGLFKVNNLRDGLLSTLYFTFKANNKEISVFLDKYFTLSNRANNFLRKFVLVGDRYITADPAYILSGKIFSPSLPEQEKIASFLTKIDEKIEKLERKKELWVDYKKGVMQGIFSRDIRFKDDEGKEFPDWVESKLGEICSVKTSTLSQNTLEENFGNYALYGAPGFIKNIDFYEMENDYISIVKDGAGVGRVLFCKGQSSILGTLNYLTNKKNSNIKFIYYLLLQIKFIKYIIGSTIPHIYFKDYSKEKRKTPSLPEQEKIANFLSSLDTKIDVLEMEIEKNKGFKRGLLQGLFV